MADSAGRTESFDSAWSSFGRVLAVVSAAAIAFAGVVAHVPVWLAVLRGTIALVVVLALVRAAAAVVAALPKPAKANERSALGKDERLAQGKKDG